MHEDRVKDEFARIELVTRMQRDGEMISQYEYGLTFHRRRVEADRYQLGRLDERLEVGRDSG
ncbi:hypothetical protein ACFQZ4_26720 [Catellatospora coxensis]|uniref:Uncharacterized protein n=1 Tax=Catellatospora coxensis TaxID=310354 RepID=A0A8J3PBU6_9ACTN|nr:hypothetical protein [Catellatospora coxensis]GIG09311.1 hypothetical protein Cco03nite_60110 [Catellatospora coxensis]